jgi:hypothetical protein
MYLLALLNNFQLSTVEEPLRETILSYQTNEKPVVNLSPIVESSMAEGDALVKLKAEIPLPTKVVLLKTIHFRSVTDKLDVSIAPLRILDRLTSFLQQTQLKVYLI